MRKFGLIGYPLGHSFSKKYFTEKFENENLFDCQFDLYSIPDINRFPEILAKTPNLEGIAVTIPYKQEVIQYLDELDPACQAIGAVNSIKIKDGKLKGYNTDYIGFKKSLESWLPTLSISALVLGTGGASKAVIQALKDLNIPYLSVSRSVGKGNITYSDLYTDSEFLVEYKLIINTTPLGTFPNVEGIPNLPLDQIASYHRIYDLVYNPSQTRLMEACLKAGGQAKNGMEMLEMQAEASWTIWNS